MCVLFIQQMDVSIIHKKWCEKGKSLSYQANIIAEIMNAYLPASSAFDFLLLPHGVVLVKIVLLVTISIVLIILSSGYIGTYCCDGKK